MNYLSMSGVLNPGRAAQPSHGPGGHLLHPFVKLRAHPRGVGHMALDHLLDLPFAHPRAVPIGRFDATPVRMHRETSASPGHHSGQTRIPPLPNSARASPSERQDRGAENMLICRAWRVRGLVEADLVVRPLYTGSAPISRAARLVRVPARPCPPGQDKTRMPEPISLTSPHLTVQRSDRVEVVA